MILAIAYFCKSIFAVFLQKHICKSLQKWMHFAIANLTKTQFAKPCERCSGLASFSKILQGFASGLLQGYHWAMNLKACKSLLNTANHTCNFALKLVKPKYFCKSIFAKACKNRCIVQLQILTKNTFCKTLWKVYLLPAPPRLRAHSRSSLLSLVILNVFTLFVITIIFKPILSAVFLSGSVVCPKCFIIQVCQPTYEEIHLHSCFKSIRSCVIYLTWVVPTYSSVSSHSPGNHEMTEYQHHSWSLIQ